MDQSATPMDKVNPTPPENAKHVLRKKLFIITFLSVVFVLILIGIAYYFYTAQNPGPTINAEVKSAPVFTAQSYYYNGQLPEVSSANLYSLKPVSKDSAVQIARNLGMSAPPAEDKDTLIFSDLENKDSRGVLTFNMKSGAFAYRSYGDVQTDGENPIARANSVISQLGLVDTTTDCSITYKNSQAPGITFVECHKSWDKLGAPLLNLGGVLNIPENVLIKDVVPGEVIAGTPLNSVVFDVSNGGNGYARPNDFNTITVGLYADGSLYSIESAARTIQKEDTISASDLISADQALFILQKNKAQFALSIPSGNGVFDFNKVYPGNSANAVHATITEVLLAYLDKPMTEEQIVYSPSYLIHGTAQLNSGYSVKFVATVPALKSENINNLEIAEGGSLQLGTFLPPTATPTNPSLPNFTLTPTQRPYNPPTQCANISGDEVVLNIPGYGSLSYIVNTDPRLNLAHTYFAVPNVFSGGARPGLYKAIEEQYLINVARYIKNHPEGFSSDMGPEQVFQKLTEIKNQVVSAGSICANLTTRYPDSELVNLPPLFTENESESCDGGSYYSSKAREIAQTISVPLSSALKNGSINSLAARSNIFPDKTLVNFHWILSGAPVGYLQGLEDVVGFGTESINTYACIVSGASPAIFVTSDTPRNIEIKTQSHLTYSDPAAVSNAWKGTVAGNMFKSSQGVVRSHIYYEYDSKRTSFTEPSTGYVIERSEIKELSDNLSQQLGLNVAESLALLSDIQKAAVDLGDARYIKVSVIDPHELDVQLPLTILPKPQTVTRFHVLLSATSAGENVVEQKLKKVKRSAYSVLEIGAAAQKR